MDMPIPRRNHLGQPIGAELPGWTPRPRPGRAPMAGRFARLEPREVLAHAEDLWAAFALDTEGRNWTYVPCGPFATAEAFRAWLSEQAAGGLPQA